METKDKVYRLMRRMPDGTFKDMGFPQRCVSCNPGEHPELVTKIMDKADPTYTMYVCLNRDCPNFNNKNPINLEVSNNVV